MCPCSSSRMRLWWRYSESGVLTSYSGWHNSECETLGTWSGHHQNNNKNNSSNNNNNNNNNIWYQWKWIRNQETYRQGEQVQHPILGVWGQGVLQAVGPGYMGWTAPSKTCSFHTWLIRCAHYETMVKEAHTAGEKGKTKANTAGGSIYERLLWCLKHIVLSIVSKSHPWGKAKHAASGPTVEWSWEISSNQGILLCAGCSPWRPSQLLNEVNPTQSGKRLPQIPKKVASLMENPLSTTDIRTSL